MYAGDIAAAVGLKNTRRAIRSAVKSARFILETMEFPEPVIRVRDQTTKTKAGQEKMGIALVELAEEDPTFKTYTDQETGQTIIAGMGELHLEIIVDRLLREFNVEATSANRRFPTRRRISGTRQAESPSTPDNPAARGSTATSRSLLTRTSPARAMSSSTRLLAVQSRRNTSPLSIRAYKALMLAGILAGYQVVDVK